MSKLIRSWVESANDPLSPFPLNNLPCGVFSIKAKNGDERKCGVAIGDYVLDIATLESKGVIALSNAMYFNESSWNKFMAAGGIQWQQFRKLLLQLLNEDTEVNKLSEDNLKTIKSCLIPLEDVSLHMSFRVSEYTDFYAGKHHAINVGSMFRDPENALPPNWLHIPIGYNGRASSVVVSGTNIRRPWGQLKGPNDEKPHFGPAQRFDIELELGAIVGQASEHPLTVDQADNNIFGYVLLNDWSARDIQAWEYQPLGPFQAKATATSISPWIITKEALEPFRVSTPEREKELLPYLQESKPMLYDIDLVATIQPEKATKATTLTRTNYKQMYYSSAQQLAHHSSAGCPMNTGDLLGSGTISGPTKAERGSMLELSWGGKEPITLDTGETRSFIEDGDELRLTGHCQGDGYQIGFGECVGSLLPALEDIYKN